MGCAASLSIPNRGRFKALHLMCQSHKDKVRRSRALVYLWQTYCTAGERQNPQEGQKSESVSLLQTDDRLEYRMSLSIVIVGKRREAFLTCASSFFKPDWCGHLVIQIKRREGDQDRVRLAGLWIKAGFRSVKIDRCLKSGCSANWSRLKGCKNS